MNRGDLIWEGMGARLTLSKSRECNGLGANARMYVAELDIGEQWGTRLAVYAKSDEEAADKLADMAEFEVSMVRKTQLRARCWQRLTEEIARKRPEFLEEIRRIEASEKGNIIKNF